MKTTTLLLIVSLTLLGLTTAGCAPSHDQIRAENRLALASITVGMTRAEVDAVMGLRTIRTTQGWITNPHRTEVRRADNGDTYDVLYYYTTVTVHDGKVSDRELTPVVLQDGHVIGWGSDFLKALLAAD
ncbi:MAG: DUF3192 domain-containing protein [Phycisphaerales bacterium]|nr:DUF3192 domain-containing protein [Phycisphaerales bacterium]